MIAAAGPHQLPGSRDQHGGAAPGSCIAVDQGGIDDLELEGHDPVALLRVRAFPILP